ncbi:hypothetical protein SJR90_11740 [Aeromonas caviae]|uniref:hypothetical protein n=1 Tax=Aeromonas caviae TaxID=648 RepID=UPI0029D98A10|nr:hypothetical protein [Aeromonas caviae]MDX7783009.1 hypothetical protein [Aeromonas caviae]
MKLYVEEKDSKNGTSRKLYINKIAENRSELARSLGSKDFYINNEKYFVSQVKAEKSADKVILGATVGGLVGIIGGTFGIAAGSLLGTAFGKSADNIDAKKVEDFNRSKL